jgi:hypothetical protein
MQCAALPALTGMQAAGPDPRRRLATHAGRDGLQAAGGAVAR